MQRETKLWLLGNVATPFLRGVGFAVKVIYATAFAWWLDPWLQRKANRKLLIDVEENFFFLFSEAEKVKLPPAGRLIDYASVEFLWKNLFFSITRRRGEVDVSIAPRHAMNEQSELGPTIAALEGRHFSESYAIGNLADAAALLRPRLKLLNNAFSEQEYVHTRQRI